MGPMTIIITQIEDTSDVVPTHVTLMTFDSIISLNNDAIVGMYTHYYILYRQF